MEYPIGHGDVIVLWKANLSQVRHHANGLLQTEIPLITEPHSHQSPSKPILNAHKFIGTRPRSCILICSTQFVGPRPQHQMRHLRNNYVHQVPLFTHSPHLWLTNYTHTHTPLGSLGSRIPQLSHLVPLINLLTLHWTVQLPGDRLQDAGPCFRI